MRDKSFWTVKSHNLHERRPPWRVGFPLRKKILRLQPENMCGLGCERTLLRSTDTNEEQLSSLGSCRYLKRQSERMWRGVQQSLYIPLLTLKNVNKNTWKAKIWSEARENFIAIQFANQGDTAFGDKLKVCSKGERRFRLGVKQAKPSSFVSLLRLVRLVFQKATLGAE